MECVCTGLFVHDCPWIHKSIPGQRYFNVPRVLIVAASQTFQLVLIFLICQGWSVTFFTMNKKIVGGLVLGVGCFIFTLVYYLVDSSSNAINDFIEVIMLLLYCVISVLCLFKLRRVILSMWKFSFPNNQYNLSTEICSIFEYKFKLTR
jgi:hypothetical protein